MLASLLVCGLAVMAVACGGNRKTEEAKDGKISYSGEKTAGFIIGPEGGFSEKEIAKLSACGMSGQPVTLGKTILRTETAGLAALAMIMYEANQA